MRKKKKISVIPVHPEYSHEDLLKITSGYDTLVHLKRTHPDLYKFIKDNHLQSAYGSHMKISNKSYDHKYLKGKCSEYKDQIELRKSNKRLYYYLVNNKILSKYFPKRVARINKDSIVELVKECKSIADFRRLHPGAYGSAKRQGFLKEIIKNKPKITHSKKIYTNEEILSLAKNYKCMTEFSNSESLAYNQSKNRKILPKIKALFGSKNMKVRTYSIKEVTSLVKKYNTLSSFKKDHPFAMRIIYANKLSKKLFKHMKKGFRTLTKKELINIAKKFKTRAEFSQKDAGAYGSAIRRGILEEVCRHMKTRRKKLTKSDIIKIASKYSTRGEFLKNDVAAYSTASKLKMLEDCCKHMEPKNSRQFIKEEILYEIAKKYKHRVDFYNEDRATYVSAQRRRLLDDICKHMVDKPKAIKKSEKAVLSFVQSHFKDAINKWFYNLKIKRRPYIKSFELDILVPSLNKAIEFDGTKWHSKEYLLKKVKKGGWTKHARLNYHKIKDKVFLDYFNIKILHITDTEWIKDPFSTKQKIIDFLTS